MTTDFGDIPDDLFDGFDWSAFEQSVVDEQIVFVNTLDETVLDRLGGLVDGYEAAAERRKRVLHVVHGLLSMGLRLSGLSA